MVFSIFSYRIARLITPPLLSSHFQVLMAVQGLQVDAKGFSEAGALTLTLRNQFKVRLVRDGVMDDGAGGTKPGSCHIPSLTLEMLPAFLACSPAAQALGPHLCELRTR